MLEVETGFPCDINKLNRCSRCLPLGRPTFQRRRSLASEQEVAQDKNDQ